MRYEPELVQISGRTVEIVTAGHGDPLVVLESGLGDDWSSWSPVLEPLAERSRILAYSRPGYGRSSAVSTPRDLRSEAQELHSLLQALHERSPYVLVGHSLGGLIVQAFANTYPRECAGVVTLDAPHPDLIARLNADTSVAGETYRKITATLTGTARAEHDAIVATQGGQFWGDSPLYDGPMIMLSAWLGGSFAPEVWRPVRRTLAKEAVARYPQAELRNIYCDHYIHRERPLAVIDAVDEILARTRGPVLSMFSTAYKRYVIALMATVYGLNLMDRGLIMLLLQPIKEDLSLSDTQLGLITGIAFGLFYATLGLPIARWADRGNRVTITSMAIGLWGLTVMACLLVTNYVQLVFARIAAAIGEAGCKPPTYSLVGDYFPQPAERTRAMTIYWLGGPLATLVSFIVGGWLNELYGWRMTFLIMGIPGLILAVVVKLTIVEPRVKAASIQHEKQTMPSMGTVLTLLWQNRACRHMCIALILLYTLSFGMAPWYAAFMARSHGMGTRELGVWLGLIFGVGGVAGTLLGGYIANRWFAADDRGQMRLSAVTVACIMPCFIVFVLVPNKALALIAMTPLMMVLSIFIAPAYALLQRLVPDEMRATTLAVVMLLSNLIGMGLGPQIVGILSDALAPKFGSDSLRYAMLAMSFIAVGSGYHFWQVGRWCGKDTQCRI